MSRSRNPSVLSNAARPSAMLESEAARSLERNVSWIRAFEVSRDAVRKSIFISNVRSPCPIQIGSTAIRGRYNVAHGDNVRPTLEDGANILDDLTG